MKKISSLVSIFGTLALMGAGCTASKQATGAMPQDFSVQYSVNGCYEGPCPIYSIKINADGTGAYEGVQFVETTGIKSITLSPQEMEKLFQEIQRLNFFSLRDKSWGPLDEPVVRPRSIQVTENGKTKTVTNDLGNAEMSELARLIENTVKIDRFISANVDSSVCVQRYGDLKREYDACRTSLGATEQTIESQRQKEEASQKIEVLWRKIASSSDDDKRWIGVALMTTSTKVSYAEQWDQTGVIEKKKSPSGKQTLVIFGQTYDPSSLPIQRGFYILNEKGDFVSSYVTPDVWEHFSIGSVTWKNEQTISYNYYLATEGDEVPPPEKREFSLKK